jgi:hypothetical protein
VQNNTIAEKLHQAGFHTSEDGAPIVPRYKPKSAWKTTIARGETPEMLREQPVPSLPVMGEPDPSPSVEEPSLAPSSAVSTVAPEQTAHQDKVVLQMEHPSSLSSRVKDRITQIAVQAETLRKNATSIQSQVERLTSQKDAIDFSLLELQEEVSTLRAHLEEAEKGEAAAMALISMLPSSKKRATIPGIHAPKSFSFRSSIQSLPVAVQPEIIQVDPKSGRQQRLSVAPIEEIFSFIAESRDGQASILDMKARFNLDNYNAEQTLYRRLKVLITEGLVVRGARGVYTTAAPE